ncbi:MAG: DUF1003 domain-containing protein [Actinobacteria bacterium]|nr:MAG: DUF1003 domain-containing protein [Actinomycetota bacterium]TMM14085.1 MAG: DUF1003 domain-containing protein [Actinomycetota bacterium]
MEMEGRAVPDSYAKHQAQHAELHGAFGADRFGAVSERVARFFGTPKYILGQTMIVIVWIALNGAAISFRWDPYPFILLNLAFSTQAAYAAPLILLAQTRQADRDKAHEEAAARHRDELANREHQMLDENTTLTEQVAKLAREIDTLTKMIHAQVCDGDG